MEQWTPLFDIFLNSPSPESEASLWLTKAFNSSSNTSPISTASFLSLLTALTDERIMWIHTLPELVQVRVLSYLAYDHQRFSKSDLCKLARGVLSEGKKVDFWVKKAAHHLLDLVSVSNYGWISDLSLDSEEVGVEDEFSSLPEWLANAAKDSKPLLSWLPFSCDELSEKMDFDGDVSTVIVEDEELGKSDEVMEEVEVDESKIDEAVDAETEKRAKSLNGRVLSLDSASKAVELGNEICEVCMERKERSLSILSLIEPWNVADEFVASLISHLLDGNDGDELGWTSHVFCSVILPKLLMLKEPPSRLLMSATIEYCKPHQRSTEYAILFPLILQTNGINNHACDVVTKVVKECLQAAHVSAFCHKLLGGEKDARKFICLPCHRCLIGDEVVWTESLFILFQNILNYNVHLDQDSVDQLVHLVCKFTARYSRSLKFCTFILCFVRKCAPLLKHHKLLLASTLKNTNSLVTKSILLKLSAL